MLWPVPPLETGSRPEKPKVRLLLLMVPVMFVSEVTKPTKVEPRVELLVPPLAMGRMPLISEPLMLIAPLINWPLAKDLTGRARLKEVMVVEPTTAKVVIGEEELIPTLPADVTVKYWLPLDEATAKGLVPPLPWTKRVVEGALVPMPTKSVEVAL
jgi:hypothetical protein